MAQEKYNSCSSDESNRFLSETNSESTLFLGDSTTKQNPRRSFFTYNKILLSLVVLLLGLNGASILLLSRSTTKTVSDDYYLTNSFGHKQTPIVTRIYQDYGDDFLNFNATISRSFWADLFPPGGGIIGLTTQQASAMDLHDSIQGRSDPTKHLYLVAAFHQLHCLSQLRWITMSLHQDPSFSIKDPTYHHTMHCVDVLRQALMCHTDSTLIYKIHGEWPGENGKRVCKNFDALKSWTTENAYISMPNEVEELAPGHINA